MSVFLDEPMPLQTVLRIPIRGYEISPRNAAGVIWFVTNPYKGLWDQIKLFVFPP